jgi:HEAT repeat protein
MREHRKKILIALGCVMLAVFAILFSFRNTEPTYEDHTLSYWLMEYGPGKGSARHEKAREAISHIGTNALPYLLKWIRREGDSPAGSALKSFFRKMPDAITPGPMAQWASGQKSNERANSAANAFPLLGKEARLAIPSLTQMMSNTNHPGIPEGTLRALFFMGEDGIPPLLAILANTNAPNRSSILALLRGDFEGLVKHTSLATPVLVQCLADSDPAVRGQAEDVFDRIAQREPSLTITALTNSLNRTIPSLLKMMNDRNATNASKRAIGVLAKMGENGLPSLLVALTNTNTPNRGEIVRCIYIPARAANAVPVVPMLLQCLQDNDHEVRGWAAASLGRIGRDPSVVVPALTNCLRESDQTLRARATQALGRYGEQARVSVPLLLNQLTDPNPGVRNLTTNALREIAPEVLTNAPSQ